MFIATQITLIILYTLYWGGENMSLKVLHCADIHLDTVFSFLDETSANISGAGAVLVRRVDLVCGSCRWQ